MARAGCACIYSNRNEVLIHIYKCLTLPDASVAHHSCLRDATFSGASTYHVHTHNTGNTNKNRLIKLVYTA